MWWADQGSRLRLQPFQPITEQCLFTLLTDVTAIIFVVACSSYNLVLREDPSQVRLSGISSSARMVKRK